MLRTSILARLTAVCTLAWPMGVAWASDQLDQLEVLMARQRAQQEQLGALIKQTQAELGRGPSVGSSWGLPELTMQGALLSAGVVAAVLMCGAMLWLWKNRMPSSVAYRPRPEPRYKESGYTDSAFAGLSGKGAVGTTSAFKTSGFKTSGFKDSSFKDSSFKDSSFKDPSFKNSSFKDSTSKKSAFENTSASPAGFSASLQDSSWTDSWASDTSPMKPLKRSTSPSLPAAEQALVEQPDISLDDLESDFEPSVMDFDLSDFDPIDSPAVAQPDPTAADPFVTLEVPSLPPLTPADFDFALTQPDEDDTTEATAVFIAGEVDHRESAFDLLKFDPNALTVPAAAAAVTMPLPRPSAKIDSEVPSKYDQLAQQPLRPAVAYVSPLAGQATPTPEPDSGFTGSAFGQLQLNAPPEILPYPNEMSDDDAPYATQLQLARECAEIGQVDEAELLCQEVFTNGTEPMREYALYILTRLPEFKRK